jgi:hypothetical protein
MGRGEGSRRRGTTPAPARHGRTARGRKLLQRGHRGHHGWLQGRDGGGGGLPAPARNRSGSKLQGGQRRHNTRPCQRGGGSSDGRCLGLTGGDSGGSQLQRGHRGDDARAGACTGPGPDGEQGGRGRHCARREGAGMGGRGLGGLAADTAGGACGRRGAWWWWLEEGGRVEWTVGGGRIAASVQRAPGVVTKTHAHTSMHTHARTHTQAYTAPSHRKPPQATVDHHSVPHVTVGKRRPPQSTTGHHRPPLHRPITHTVITHTVITHHHRTPPPPPPPPPHNAPPSIPPP